MSVLFFLAYRFLLFADSGCIQVRQVDLHFLDNSIKLLVHALARGGVVGFEHKLGKHLLLRHWGCTLLRQGQFTAHTCTRLGGVSNIIHLLNLFYKTFIRWMMSSSLYILQLLLVVIGSTGLWAECHALGFLSGFCPHGKFKLKMGYTLLLGAKHVLERVLLCILIFCKQKRLAHVGLPCSVAGP